MSRNTPQHKIMPAHPPSTNLHANNNNNTSNHITHSAESDHNKKDRFDEHDFALWKQVETYKIWKMLNNPETNHIDPQNPYHIIYNPYNPEKLEKEVIILFSVSSSSD